MKINNKFALLIIMSLFLLISLGSAYASDNNLTDQDMQTYDENSDEISINNEIEDNNAILSDGNNNELLKANSNSAINVTPTSVDVNSSKIVEVKIKSNESIDINDLKPTVTYKDSNATKTIKTSNYNLNNGTYSFKLNNLNFKTALLALTYKGDSISNITLNRIYNADIQVVKDSAEYRVGNFSFKIVDRDNNNKPIPDVEVSLTTIGNIRAGFSAKTNKNGIASFDADKLYEFTQDSTLTMKYLSAGYHNVTIATKDNIKSSSKTVRLSVSKGTVKIVVDKYNEPYGSDKNVTITVTKSNGAPLTGEIIHLTMPQTTEKTYYFSTDSNGTCKINVKNLIPGTYSYTVNANNTESIKLQKVSGTITINKVRVDLTISTHDIEYNSEVTATITVKYAGTNNAVPNAIIKVQAFETNSDVQEYRFQTNEKGTVSFSASLSVGKHKIRVNIAEDNYEPRYVAYEITGFVNVGFANAKYEAPKVTAYYNDGKTFNVKVVNVKNGKGMYDTKVRIDVYTSSTTYIRYTGTTDANGYLKLSLKDYEPGTYKVVISNPDTKNYKSSEVTSQFVIKNKIATKLTVTSLTAPYKSNSYIIARLTDTNGKPISGAKIGFANNGVKYATTDANGKARYYTNELKEGSYDIKAKFYGDNTHQASSQATSKVVITSNRIATKLTVTDLTAPYKSNRYIIARLTDTNGKPISGAKIGFANNGVKYATTDANGKARYYTNELKEGTYYIKTAYYGDDTHQASNQATSKVVISKVATKLTVTSVSTTYNSGKYVIATLTDANGNPIQGAKIGFANNGVKYVTTDSSGKARYYLTGLKEGNYDIKVAYYGNDTYKASNQATSKVVISKIATKLTVTSLTAKHKSNSYIIARLTDSNGNAISGVKIGFANNGVKYATTDANGKARFYTSNLAVGTYNIIAAFFGTDAYQASNKATSKVTITQ
ncbi:hypothetical protein [Methanobrevibacter sp.]|uniref:hypothetical protein n=1 Tax=Methanobrevibacter sp. TaxID=66852 RepID=UPI00388CF59E